MRLPLAQDVVACETAILPSSAPASDCDRYPALARHRSRRAYAASLTSRVSCFRSVGLVSDDNIGGVEVPCPRPAHPDPDRAELLHELSRGGDRVIH
jgi:hypothetical protein